MPKLGEFVMHSRAVPPLAAGDYRLEGAQQVAGGPTAPHTAHLRITSPRYRMPPDQILSTFPPANAEGAFESRLPQVVLRRRTLPWERIAKAGDPNDINVRKIPWLALVVIAEGEGQLSGEVPVADCVTPGVALAGPNDVATGVYLAVSDTVVKKVFPTEQDLDLLVHVREVDINDTELAIGDDDGFLAVVMANRLPQFDRDGCAPVRYLACLINLEGQLGVLPPPSSDPALTFLATQLVQDVRVLARDSTPSADHVVMGKGVKQTTLSGVALHEATPVASVRSPSTAGASFSAPNTRSQAAASWASSPRQIEAVAVSAAPAEAGRLVRDAMGAGWRFPVEYIVKEKTYRFPVLAHWSFTTTGAGSFRTLMQGLDVGLLGTLPADPAARPKPDCTPAAKGDAPPAAPPTRPDPEATETGHIGLEHLTRRGDRLRAWYRGPFTLHVTTRDTADGDSRLPLAHTSDQLRRITPDGREDLALAGAFEIGRLLALSQPSIVSALMRWRREQFGAERARRLAERALEGLASLKTGLGNAVSDFGRLVGRNVVVGAARSPAKILAPSRPLTDPGRPVKAVGADVDEVIARGFGFSLSQVRELSTKFGPAAALRAVTVPTASADRFDPSANVRLRQGLSDAVQGIAADAIGNIAGPGARPGDRKRDALDDLIDAATRTREGGGGTPA